MRPLSTLIAIAVLFGSSEAAGTARSSGTPAVFSDEVEFLAAAGAVVKENFEDNFTTADCDSGALSVIPLNHFTATSDIPALKLLAQDCFGNHNTTADGLKYLGADTDVSGVSAAVAFDFVQPLNAFGLFLVDLDFAILNVTVNGVAYPVPENGDGGVSYFGIVSPDPFTNVTFQIVTAFDAHYSFDDLAYGPPVGPVGVGEGNWRAWGSIKADYRRPR